MIVFNWPPWGWRGWCKTVLVLWNIHTSTEDMCKWNNDRWKRLKKQNSPKSTPRTGSPPRAREQSWEIGRTPLHTEDPRSFSWNCTPRGPNATLRKKFSSATRSFSYRRAGELTEVSPEKWRQQKWGFGSPQAPQTPHRDRLEAAGGLQTHFRHLSTQPLDLRSWKERPARGWSKTWKSHGSFFLLELPN